MPPAWKSFQSKLFLGRVHLDDFQSFFCQKPEAQCADGRAGHVLRGCRNRGRNRRPAHHHQRKRRPADSWRDREREVAGQPRSEERRGGKEWVRKCRWGGGTSNETKKKRKTKK